MSGVQRLRDELDEDEQRQGSRSASRARQAVGGSRRGSQLGQALLPGASSSDAEDASPPGEGEHGAAAAAVGERSHSSNNSPGSPAREVAGSPLPGAIESPEAVRVRPGSRADSAAASAAAGTSSTSSKRGRALSPRVTYTTTLEEDAARDARELAQRQQLEAERQHAEDMEIEEARAREAQVAGDPAAASALGVSAPLNLGLTSKRSSQQQQQAPPSASYGGTIAVQRPSSAVRHADSAALAVRHREQEAALLPGAPEPIEGEDDAPLLPSGGDASDQHAEVDDGTASAKQQRRSQVRHSSGSGRPLTPVHVEEKGASASAAEEAKATRSTSSKRRAAAAGAAQRGARLDAPLHVEDDDVGALASPTGYAHPEQLAASPSGIPSHLEPLPSPSQQDADNNDLLLSSPSGMSLPISSPLSGIAIPSRADQRADDGSEEKKVPASPAVVHSPNDDNGGGDIDEHGGDVLAAAADHHGAVGGEEEDDDEPVTPMPVFEHVVRQYAVIDDPLAELKRIRATKDFEADFDDLALPRLGIEDDDDDDDDDEEDEDDDDERAEEKKLARLKKRKLRQLLATKPNPLRAAYAELQSLRSEAEEEPLQTFNESMLLDDGDVLHLRQQNLEEVRRTEAVLESERVALAQAELARTQRREHELGVFAHALSRHHLAREEHHKSVLAEKEHQLLQRSRLLQQEEQESFRRAEDRMREFLLRNKGATLHTHMTDLSGAAERERERDLQRAAAGFDTTKPGASSTVLAAVAAFTGNNMNVDDLSSPEPKAEVSDLYAAVRSRVYDVSWNYEPRLLRLRIDWLRGVKNKLPAGNYQIMVTLYDRLGGDALRWTGPTVVTEEEGGTKSSAMAGRKLNGSVAGGSGTTFSPTGSTVLPVRHAGKFFHTDLLFNQRANRIFLACPPAALTRPSMVFVFELFLCGDQNTAAAAAASATTAARAVSSSLLGGGGGGGGSKLDSTGDDDDEDAPGKGRSNVFSSMASSALSMASSAQVLAQEMLLKARNPKQYALLKAAQANARAIALARAPPSSDRVVAWGAFPLASVDRELISGNFKLPLLRGSYEREGCDKFDAIQQRVANDLDSWLCNLYFNARPWPRLLDNAQEHGVALRFRGASKRKNKNKDGASDDDLSSEEEEEHEELHVGEDGSLVLTSAAANNNAASANADATGAPTRKLAASGTAAAAAAQHHGRTHSLAGNSSMSMGSIPADILVLDNEDGTEGHGELHAPYNSQRRLDSSVAEQLGLSSGSNAGGGGGGMVTPPAGLSSTMARASLRAARRAKKSANLRTHGSAAHEAATAVDRGIAIKLHTRKYPGLLRDIPDGDEALAADLRNVRKRAEICQRYRHNVNLPDDAPSLLGGDGAATTPHSSDSDKPSQRAAYKFRFVANELWQDMGVRRLRDWQFLFLLIFASLYVRIYTHYLSQQLFLASLRIPLSVWECHWYVCDVVYSWDPQSVTAQTQVGVVAFGTLGNMIAFAVMSIALAGWHRVLGRSPDWMSRFLLAWGLGTVVEPLLILLIDCCASRWHGDSFKLYQWYLAKDGNGMAGVFMTILVQMLLITLATVLFYLYVRDVHMAGRILDVHRRLHGGPELFHLPHDMEVSVRELRWILHKAERWVGLGGQKRKVVVSKFLVRDPLRSVGKTVASSSPTAESIYVALYTQSQSGDVELHRHFLRSPCGRVSELFEPLETPGEEAFKKIEEKLAMHERRRMQALQATMASSSSSASAGGMGMGHGGGGGSAHGGGGGSSGLSVPKPLSMVGLGLGGLGTSSSLSSPFDPRGARSLMKLGSTLGGGMGGGGGGGGMATGGGVISAGGAGGSSTPSPLGLGLSSGAPGTPRASQPGRPFQPGMRSSGLGRASLNRVPELNQPI